MTHRTVYRRDLDAANTERRASFARSKTWIEVYREGQGPFLQDITGREPGEVSRICAAIELTGGTWEVKHGNPPDMPHEGSGRDLIWWIDDEITKH